MNVTTRVNKHHLCKDNLYLWKSHHNSKFKKTPRITFCMKNWCLSSLDPFNFLLKCQELLVDRRTKHASVDFSTHISIPGKCPRFTELSISLPHSHTHTHTHSFLSQFWVILTHIEGLPLNVSLEWQNIWNESWIPK